MVSASWYMSARGISAENFDQQKMTLHPQSFSSFLPGMSKRWREIALLFSLGDKMQISKKKKKEKKKVRKTKQIIRIKPSTPRKNGKESKKHERLSEAEEKQKRTDITTSAHHCPLRKLTKCITISYSPLNSTLFYDLKST